MTLPGLGRIVDFRSKQTTQEAKVQDLYKRWAPLYDRHMHETGHDVALHALLNRLAKHFGGTSAIDIACGTGTAIDYIVNGSEWLSESYPRTIIATDFSKPMLDYARAKLRMRWQDSLAAELNEKLNFAYGTIVDKELRRIGARNRMIIAGARPSVSMVQQDATALALWLPAPPNLAMCSYGFHWFLEKERVAEQIGIILPSGAKLVSIEEWPIRVTPGASASTLEHQIMSTINPIPLGKLYRMLEQNRLKLVELVESEIWSGGITSVRDLEPTLAQAERLCGADQRRHSMFGAVFLKE